MKHIYYGQKREEHAKVDNVAIGKLEIELQYYTYDRSRNKNKLENNIKRLKENLSSKYVYSLNKITKNNVYITENDHEHVCNVGEQVNLGMHQGKILDRIYDAANDVMHYFTDIIVLNIKNENINEELNEKKQEVLEKLQKLYDTYFSEEDEPVKKGFWKRLFS